MKLLTNTNPQWEKIIAGCTERVAIAELFLKSTCESDKHALIRIARREQYNALADLLESSLDTQLQLQTMQQIKQILLGKEATNETSTY